MADELFGGVSCEVRFAEHEGRSVVVKTALSKLRVEADWRADPSRADVEVEALRVARALLGADVVPEVIWHDAATHTLAMERVLEHENLKRQLLAGLVHLPAIGRAGELLARLHVESAPVLAPFTDTRHFHALRIEPFFMRVAERHSDLVPHVHETLARLAERRDALVHGDFSPKNLLVRGAHVVVLDWEIAHAGDPAFDVAFFAHHLWLKSRRVGGSALTDAGRTFLAAYTAGAPSPPEVHTVRLAALLGLARLDGDSPVDYRDDLPAEVRSMLRQLVRSPSWAAWFA